MTTVGYGDVGPSQDDMISLILVISCQVLGTMLFAYLIGVIIELVANLDPMERKRKQCIDIIREFAIEQNLSARMRKMIMINHEFYNEVKGVDNEEVEIMQKLPPKLQIESALFVHAQSLANAPLLCQLEEQLPGSFSILIPRLRPVAYIIDQIVNDPRINAREFHFVLSGTFSISHKFRRAAPNEIKNDKQSRILLLDKDKQTISTRKALESFGSSIILLPTEEFFQLNVEISCASSRATAFVLTKFDIDDIEFIFPAVRHALEASFVPENQNDWLTVLPSSSAGAGIGAGIGNYAGTIFSPCQATRTNEETFNTDVVEEKVSPSQPSTTNADESY
eukprot:CAMPEP_0197321678 /NCGR_PEP_ID=MMETSP0891-20130614/65863_1 /TAXON_ID=44058 ORGANISM="Aureoumbra lagunensis, Strain CCMP1510" /NCGR_SAMPLE_ID=MMETSP0891 /ASSEMBLY_ACC=CAM_ASM_000534 /LENGTH=336 /DNA_ID=CAMNT_0042813669 /DNA_START=200 /DNA_END=1207 /DNA_ORIENTATION=-